MAETMTSDQTKKMTLPPANNHLAFKLHQLLAKGKGNIFFSPFSISTAMAMLLCAAEGETESELRKALGFGDLGLKRDDIASVFEQYILLISEESDFFKLSCANSMICQKDFEIKEGYKKLLVESFKASVVKADFERENQETVNLVNEWVKQKTNNMITKLVESFDPDTIIVLLNAVYFKGTWLRQFNKERTFAQDFYNKGLEGNIKQVDMMHLTDIFPLYGDISMQALELPYIGEDISMLILLPRKKDGLESIEANLTSSFLEDLKKKLGKRKVVVSLPKFRLEYAKSLISCFQQLGVSRIFSRGAEFGIASDSPDLAVSEILHKAVLDVNEEGSEAAAVTMIATVKCRRSINTVPVFCADHPFAFVIYDNRKDVILFMGRVYEL